MVGEQVRKELEQRKIPFDQNAGPIKNDNIRNRVSELQNRAEPEQVQRSKKDFRRKRQIQGIRPTFFMVALTSSTLLL
jgi:hypothetical protein